MELDGNNNRLWRNAIRLHDKETTTIQIQNTKYEIKYEITGACQFLCDAPQYTRVHTGETLVSIVT